jgi:hypothetical protein
VGSGSRDPDHHEVQYLVWVLVEDTPSRPGGLAYLSAPLNPTSSPLPTRTLDNDINPCAVDNGFDLRLLGLWNSELIVSG